MQPSDCRNSAVCGLQGDVAGGLRPWCSDGVFYVRRTVDRCVSSFYEVLQVAVWQIGETAD